MKESRWRLAARKAIQKAIAENTGKSEKEVRKAISDAYPFGERARYPYKIWLDEVKAQTTEIEEAGANRSKSGCNGMGNKLRLKQRGSA